MQQLILAYVKTFIHYCICMYSYSQTNAFLCFHAGLSLAFQSVIFHVERHPVHTWFTQCVTFNFFPTPMHELAYNLFNIITVYGLPLTIISTSYIIILCEISKKTKQSKGECMYIDATTDWEFFQLRLKLNILFSTVKGNVGRESGCDTPLYFQ